jgi:hypothetical protein
MASLFALFGQAMPVDAAASSNGAGPSPALAMEAAALASGQTLVAALLGGGSAASPASLAQSLASLSVLDPASELARLTR